MKLALSGEAAKKRFFAASPLSVTLILAVWCIFLVIYTLLPQLPRGAEKLLPVAQSSPKLNATSAEEANPEATQPDLFQEPPLLPEVPLPAPEPLVAPPLPPVIQTEARVEDDLIDLVYLAAPARAHYLGDTPMTRTWKLLSTSTILTVALAVPAPVEAQEDVKKVQEDVKTILEKLDRMEKSINNTLAKVAKDVTDLRVDVTSLQSDAFTQRTEQGKTNLRVEKLEIQVSKMQADLEAVRKRLDTPAFYPPGDQFDEIKKQLVKIEQAIKQVNNTAFVAKSPPMSVGRVMLVNMYAEDLLFVVNQRQVRVSPGQMMPLEGMAAGSLSYEVISPTWGLRARQTTMLNPNETLTLTAR